MAKSPSKDVSDKSGNGNKTGRKVSARDFLAHAIAMSDKKVYEIGEESGIPSNLLSMMVRKNSPSKIPMARIPQLAKSLHVDVTYFTMLCLAEYRPDVYDAVSEALKSQPPLTAGEIELIKFLRNRSDGVEFTPVTASDWDAVSNTFDPIIQRAKAGIVSFVSQTKEPEE